VIVVRGSSLVNTFRIAGFTKAGDPYNEQRSTIDEERTTINEPTNL